MASHLWHYASALINQVSDLDMYMLGVIDSAGIVDSNILTNAPLSFSLPLLGMFSDFIPSVS